MNHINTLLYLYSLNVSKYNQSKYIPMFPDKYRGTLPIICRSSWERRLCVFLDKNPNILYWNSESIIIPYQSPVDHKIHRYFVDFLVMYKTRKGEIKKALIEVKPHSQRFMPKPPKVKSNKYLNEVTTYLVNQAKWEAATKWCEQRNIEFWVLDEYDLGIAKRKE